jgi:glycolate oxidase FAD binding subunit
VFRLHPEPEVRRWVTVEGGDLHELAHAVVHSQAVPWAVEVDGGTLSVMLGGRPDGVEARVATVQALVGGSVSDTPPEWWGTYPWQPGEIGLKVTCVLSGLRDVLAAAAEAGARVRGSVGVGVLYAAVDEPEHVYRLREVATAHGGTGVVVEAPDEVRQAVDVWGPVPALDLMQRVKQQFDTERRLAPGRFVGGI